MDQFVHQHVYGILAALWIFSNAVMTMPSPTADGPTGSVWYKWLFSVLHTIAGAVPRIFGALAPYSLIARLIAPGSENNTSSVPPSNPSPADKSAIARKGDGG